MEKLRFNIVMNTAVSVSLSLVTLLLLRQPPTAINFLLPTIEGFLIAMVLVYVIPLDKWCPVWAKKVGIPPLLLTLVSIAFVNVTVITFILNAQANSITAETLVNWAKSLPILYLTAIIASLLTAKSYERITSEKSI
ncbi:hypothetical protein [Streptococcus ovis]|uniref:hypothetical protein n=1 Tax=Streptococcus ovis TaxID=82806 RepID=UPI00035E78A4|nr:hypothetical protein [Streptococcus ovis]